MILRSKRYFVSGHSYTLLCTERQLSSTQIPLKLVTVASLAASNWTAAVLDKLEALSSLSAHSSFLQNLVPLFENLSTTSITTLLATFVALLFYAARALMHRSSFGQIYQNGGRSPYAMAARNNNDRSMSDLYEYVDDRHNVLVSQHRGQQPVFEDDEAPDIIHISYRGDSWPIEFPPYSIAEEKVTVKHVRDRVAERIGMGDQVGRVRLVYKDKDLRRNHMPLRKYGCKQNSEIAAIVSTESRDYSMRHHNSGSDSDSGPAHRRGGDDDRRRRSNSIYRRREEDLPYHPNGYLHPLDTSAHSSPRAQSPNRPHATRRDSPTGTSRPSLDRHHSPNRPTAQRRDSPTGVSRSNIQRQQSPIRPSFERQHSPHRPSPQRAHSPVLTSARTSTPSVQPSIQPPKADPNSQLGKIQAMRYQFHTEYAPLLNKFIRNPPPDKDDRDKEYRRLNEVVYKMVFEKGDAIEPEGADKEEIRSTRKQLYRDAQAVLKDLDKYKPHTD